MKTIVDLRLQYKRDTGKDPLVETDNIFSKYEIPRKEYCWWIEDLLIELLQKTKT